jgi:hypothetical protein
MTRTAAASVPANLHETLPCRPVAAKSCEQLAGPNRRIRAAVEVTPDILAPRRIRFSDIPRPANPGDHLGYDD